MKRILPSFLALTSKIHTASWSSDEKRFFFCEKDIVESTSVPRLNRTHRNSAIRDFLQKVDAEK
jgi:hypothetical protein